MESLVGDGKTYMLVEIYRRYLATSRSLDKKLLAFKKFKHELEIRGKLSRR